MNCIISYYYQPKWSFGQGNVFIGVCHSVNRGGYLTRHTPRPGRYTPSPLEPGRYTPSDQAGTPPWPGRYTPPGPGRYTPPDQAGTSPQTRYTPQTRQVPPRLGRYPPGPGTPHLGPGRYTPQTRYTHQTRQVHPPPQTRKVHPPKQQTPEYGQRLAGTHPTGMLSCFTNKIEKKFLILQTVSTVYFYKKKELMNF